STERDIPLRHCCVVNWLIHSTSRGEDGCRSPARARSPNPAGRATGRRMRYSRPNVEKAGARRPPRIPAAAVSCSKKAKPHMKAICNRGALLEALSVVGQAVQARTPKPVLQCVRLTCGGDRLTLAATDMEIAVRYADAQVQIEDDGETLLPADKLRDIVRESMDDTLSIELKGEQCVIRGADSRFTVYTQNPADFPAVPDFEGEADFEIAGGLLKRLIGKTLFAAAREGTRYAFNGVLTTVGDGRVTMVSTDGRRRARVSGEGAGGSARKGKD